jgi:N-carbamoyl-L-amino-acid hydrolase
MNQICPTAMIFVPSIGGRSHVEVENTPWEDCEAGANVLLQSVLRSAGER